MAGCGGADGVPENTNTDNPIGANQQIEKVLILEFMPPPLEPIAFNLVAGQDEPKNHFSPGDTIYISWNTFLHYSDNTDVEETMLYDAEVYLSDDEEIQTDVDLQLFSIECSYPETTNHACGYYGSIQCVYAEDNSNVISCTSVPFNKSLGISDLAVDSTSFIDAIPKVTNVLYRLCLRDYPENCAVSSVTIQLN